MSESSKIEWSKLIKSKSMEIINLRNLYAIILGLILIAIDYNDFVSSKLTINPAENIRILYISIVIIYFLIALVLWKDKKYDFISTSVLCSIVVFLEKVFFVCFTYLLISFLATSKISFNVKSISVVVLLAFIWIKRYLLSSNSNDLTEKVNTVNDKLKRSKLLKQIEEALNIDEVKILGLTGKWGVGKTTLVKLYEQSKKNTSFIEIDMFDIDSDITLLSHILLEVLRIKGISLKDIKPFSLNPFGNNLSAILNELIDETSLNPKSLIDLINKQTLESEKSFILVVDNFDRVEDPTELRFLINQFEKLRLLSKFRVILIYDNKIINQMLVIPEEIEPETQSINIVQENYIEKFIDAEVKVINTIDSDISDFYIDEIMKAALSTDLYDSPDRVIDTSEELSRANQITNYMLQTTATIRQFKRYIVQLMIRLKSEDTKWDHLYRPDILILEFIRVVDEQLYLSISNNKEYLTHNIDVKVAEIRARRPEIKGLTGLSVPMEQLLSVVFPILNPSIIFSSQTLKKDFMASNSKYFDNYFLYVPEQMGMDDVLRRVFRNEHVSYKDLESIIERDYKGVPDILRWIFLDHNTASKIDIKTIEKMLDRIEDDSFNKLTYDFISWGINEYEKDLIGYLRKRFEKNTYSKLLILRNLTRTLRKRSVYKEVYISLDLLYKKALSELYSDGKAINIFSEDIYSRYNSAGLMPLDMNNEPDYNKSYVQKYIGNCMVENPKYILLLLIDRLVKEGRGSFDDRIDYYFLSVESIENFYPYKLTNNIVLNVLRKIPENHYAYTEVQKLVTIFQEAIPNTDSTNRDFTSSNINERTLEVITSFVFE